MWRISFPPVPAAIIVSLVAAWSGPAWANGTCSTEFQGRYGNGAGTTYAAAGCQTCHTVSIPALNAYGRDVATCSATSIANAETLDSDTVDGQPSVGGNNLAEIDAGAQPGWCVPTTPGCDNVTDPPGSITGPLDPATGGVPVANAGGPYQGEAGVAVQFDGSASSDPDGDALTYQWNFGDGGTGSGATPTHTYVSEGEYTATLLVNDGQSDSDPDPATVSIAAATGDQPPVANPGGPYTGQTGAPIQFDGSLSADPNGSPLTYLWDFGDSSTATVASPTHTYTAAGIYTVTLVVNDGTSDSEPATTTATVSDTLPGNDGQVLYDTNCLGCHGDPWASPPYDDALPGIRRVTGARECTITGSLNGTSVYPGGVPAMQYLQGTFTAEQVAAIATYLNSRSVTGEQRYVTACAGCHGEGGAGGPVGENIRGEEAGETAEAIREESEMRFLLCLSSSDVSAITSYLSAQGGGSGDDDDDDEDDGGGGAGGLSFLLLAGLGYLARRRPGPGPR